MTDELPDDPETLKAIIKEKNKSIELLEGIVDDVEYQRDVLLDVGSFPEGVEEIYEEDT